MNIPIEFEDYVEQSVMTVFNEEGNLPKLLIIQTPHGLGGTNLESASREDFVGIIKGLQIVGAHFFCLVSVNNTLEVDNDQVEEYRKLYGDDFTKWPGDKIRQVVLQFATKTMTKVKIAQISRNKENKPRIGEFRSFDTAFISKDSIQTILNME